MSSHFLNSLDAVSGRLRLRLGAGRLCLVLAGVGVAVSAGAAWDAWHASLSPANRAAVMAVAAGLPLLAAGASFYMARRRWSRASVAAALESGDPLDRQLFVTALESATAPASAKENDLDADFRALLLVRATRRIDAVDTRPVVGVRRLIAPAALAATVTLAMLAAVATSSNFRIGLARIAMPYSPLTYTEISPSHVPDDFEPGEPLSFLTGISGRDADRVELVMEVAGKTTRQPMVRGDKGWRFEMLAPVADKIVFHVEAGDGASAPVTLERRFLQVSNAIRWPEAFRRPESPAAFAAAFPEGSAFRWKFKMAPGRRAERIELRRMDNTAAKRDPEPLSAVPLTAGADGFFSASRDFSQTGVFQARVVSVKSGDSAEITSPWCSLTCREDRAPKVVLIDPADKEAGKASPIDRLPCKLSATDDWGLARVGFALMVDDRTTEEGVMTLDGAKLEVVDATRLLLARHPGLGPEHSVVLWAFAVDCAGRRGVSRALPLDIRAEYAKDKPPAPKEEKTEEEKPKPPGPPQPPKPPSAAEKLARLIKAQRAVFGETLPLSQTGKGAVPDILVGKQARLLDALNEMAAPDDDGETPPPTSVDDENKPRAFYPPPPRTGMDPPESHVLPPRTSSPPQAIP